MPKFLKFHGHVPRHAPTQTGSFSGNRQHNTSRKGGMVVMLSLLILACGQSQEPDPQTPVTTENKSVDSAAPDQARTLIEPSSDPIVLGKKVFRSCTSCHSDEKGGNNRVGPNLYGIYGAKIATREGFSYSKAFLKSEIIWDDQALDAFLLKPSKFIPNNRMPFGGVRNDEKRAHLIAYLKSLKDVSEE